MLTDDDCENLIEGTERRLTWWLQNRMVELGKAFRKHDNDLRIWVDELEKIDIPLDQRINEDEAIILLNYLDDNYRFQLVRS